MVPVIDRTRACEEALVRGCGKAENEASSGGFPCRTASTVSADTRIPAANRRKSWSNRLLRGKTIHLVRAR